MFSDHSGMKLEINSRKNFEKTQKYVELNNTLLIMNRSKKKSKGSKKITLK